jgi:hypothetical protein
MKYLCKNCLWHNWYKDYERQGEKKHPPVTHWCGQNKDRCPRVSKCDAFLLLSKPEGKETDVNCPACGEQVRVIVEPYEEAARGLAECLEGHGKNSYFQGQGKCKCGKLVFASLYVAARDREAGGYND